MFQNQNASSIDIKVPTINVTEVPTNVTVLTALESADSENEKDISGHNATFFEDRQSLSIPERAKQQQSLIQELLAKVKKIEDKFQTNITLSKN